MAGKIARLLSQIVSAINPPMHRAWYWDNKTGKRTTTKWCADYQELYREIGALPKGTEIIGMQTDPHGEIY